MAGLAACVIGGTWTAATLLILNERTYIFSEAGNELLGAQKVLRAHVARTFGAAETVAAAVDIWLSETPDASLRRLDGVMKRLPGFDQRLFSLYLFNTAGQRLWSDPGSRARIFPPGDAAAAGEALAPGTVRIENPRLDTASDVQIIPLRMAAHPNVHGVASILIEIRADHFSEAYRDLFLLAPAIFGVVRQDGVLLLHIPDEKAALGKSIRGFTLEGLMRRYGPIGLFEHPGVVSGRARLTAFAAVPQQPLVVFSSYFQDDLLVKWHKDAAYLAIIALIVTGLTLAATGWLLYLIREKDRQAAKVREALAIVTSASRAKSEFMAKMSHELRTPLNAILGFSDIISSALGGPLSTRYQEYGRDIHQSGSHLLSLIDQVLDLARIEAGKLELAEETCDLNALLQECVGFVRPLMNRKRLVVDLQLEAPPIRADRRLLRQIMLNLLSNATKYNRNDGRIVVAAQPSAEGLDVVVADTGIGIPEELLAQVFEPFGRGDSQIAQKEGIGLGLSITKSLVELHGGTIRIQSKVGEGTRVALRLPSYRMLTDRAETAMPSA